MCASVPVHFAPGAWNGMSLIVALALAACLQPAPILAPDAPGSQPPGNSTPEPTPSLDCFGYTPYDAGANQCCPPDTHLESMGCLGWPAALNLTVTARGPFDIALPMPVEPWCLSPQEWVDAARPTGALVTANVTQLRVQGNRTAWLAPHVRDHPACGPVGMGSVKWPENSTGLAQSVDARAVLWFSHDYYSCQSETDLPAGAQTRLARMQCFVV